MQRATWPLSLAVLCTVLDPSAGLPFPGFSSRSVALDWQLPVGTFVKEVYDYTSAAAVPDGVVTAGPDQSYKTMYLSLLAWDGTLVSRVQVPSECQNAGLSASPNATLFLNCAGHGKGSFHAFRIVNGTFHQLWRKAQAWDPLAPPTDMSWFPQVDRLLMVHGTQLVYLDASTGASVRSVLLPFNTSIETTMPCGKEWLAYRTAYGGEAALVDVETSSVRWVRSLSGEALRNEEHFYGLHCSADVVFAPIAKCPALSETCYCNGLSSFDVAKGSWGGWRHDADSVFFATTQGSDLALSTVALPLKLGWSVSAHSKDGAKQWTSELPYAEQWYSVFQWDDTHAVAVGAGSVNLTLIDLTDGRTSSFGYFSVPVPHFFLNTINAFPTKGSVGLVSGAEGDQPVFVSLANVVR